MDFAPNIDMSHYARSYQFTQSNVTITPPTSCLFVNNVQMNLNNSTQFVNASVPNIAQNVTINNLQNITYTNNMIGNIHSIQPSLPPVPDKVNDFSASISLCTPTPYVQACYNIGTSNAPHGSVSVQTQLPVINGSVDFPISDEIMEGAEMVARWPM